MRRLSIAALALGLAACASTSETRKPTPAPAPAEPDPQPEVQKVDPLAVEGCEAQPDGTMTRDGVQTCIHAQLVGVRACYIQALTRNRDARGKVAISITVAPGGHMAEVTALTTGFEDATFDACVVERAQRWVFPPRPEERGPLKVTYPVHLTAF